LTNTKDSNNLNIKGNGIKIAIIDSGIDYTHPDLGGCLGPNCKVIDGYDFANKDNDPMDDNGHGTHCAGIAASNGAVKGVAPEAKLYAYKVLNSMGSGYTNDIIAAIERAVDPNQDGNFDDKADVISMSLGGSGDPDDPLSQAANNAVKNGVVVVVSAGNSGPGSNTVSCPACAVYAIAIGASCKPNQENEDCNQDGTPKIAQFSSRGPHRLFNKPDVVAPGVMICSSQWEDAFLEEGQQCIDDEHVAISGTSMSAPHVAGVAALLLQENLGLSPLQVKAVLEATATSFGYDTNVEGAGLVNALEAVKLQNPPPVSVITAVTPIGFK